VECRFASAERALNKALSLAPDHGLAHNYLALVLNSTNRHIQAAAEAERALALDRNLAFAHLSTGLAKYFHGCGEETEAAVREALRLSPRERWSFAWLYVAGLAALSLGHYKDAERLGQSIEANRNYPISHISLAATLANLGRLEHARAAMRCRPL
jgi:tetratricopeptide (TPR) repeat protein